MVKLKNSQIGFWDFGFRGWDLVTTLDLGHWTITICVYLCPIIFVKEKLF